MAARARNRQLGEARRNPEDEFYTQLADIERELRHYKKHFKGKVVYCNCDDPRVSNFFHYFSYNFEKLGLKKLITTCYKSQNADLFSQNDSEQAIYLEYEGDKNDNVVPDPDEIGIKPLKGDGDFRSAREHRAAQAGGHRGHQPALLALPRVRRAAGRARQEVPDHREQERDHLQGDLSAHQRQQDLARSHTTGRWGSACPDDYEPQGYVDVWTGRGRTRSGVASDNACWFTNLDISKRHEDLILYKTTTPSDYPTYDNYDAIEVEQDRRHSRWTIDGVMGVPITFLDKHNPDQFEIVGLASRPGSMPMVIASASRGDATDAGQAVSVYLPNGDGTYRAAVRTHPDPEEAAY